MNKPKARLIGLGLAFFALVFVVMNIFQYGEDPEGTFTFLYIATALAINGEMFMCVAYVRELIIIQYKILSVIIVVIIEIVFAIPSIDWTSNFINLPSTGARLFWILSLITGIVLHTVATLWFIYYCKQYSYEDPPELPSMTTHLGGLNTSTISTQQNEN